MFHHSLGQFSSFTTNKQHQQQLKINFKKKSKPKKKKTNQTKPNQNKTISKCVPAFQTPLLVVVHIFSHELTMADAFQSCLT